MALYATHEVANQANYGDAANFAHAHDHAVMRVTFDQKIVIKSVFAYYNGRSDASTALHIFKVFRVSDGANLMSQNLWLIETTGWNEYQLPTPIVLEAGVQYAIGFHVPSIYGTYIAFDTTSTSGNLTGQSTPAGITSTWVGQAYITSTDANGTVMPTTVLGDSLMIKLGVDIYTNAPPNQPQNIAAQNSPVPYGQPASVAWTHIDPDSNPQSKYQLRWRKVDT